MCRMTQGCSMSFSGLLWLFALWCWQCGYRRSSSFKAHCQVSPLWTLSVFVSLCRGGGLRGIGMTNNKSERHLQPKDNEWYEKRQIFWCKSLWCIQRKLGSGTKLKPGHHWRHKLQKGGCKQSFWPQTGPCGGLPTRGKTIQTTTTLQLAAFWSIRNHTYPPNSWHFLP